MLSIVLLGSIFQPVCDRAKRLEIELIVLDDLSLTEVYLQRVQKDMGLVNCYFLFGCCFQGSLVVVVIVTDGSDKGNCYFRICVSVKAAVRHTDLSRIEGHVLQI